ncbi:LysR substrate-binding domain-containing protein, partial [Burkholderia sp. Ac-20384]|uniref:LysR substrate-binding domain-containing protein n=1 Tax=Burkholderia sp. Ac-20384 TaxID=2703902 RepID=UPI001F11939F
CMPPPPPVAPLSLTRVPPTTLVRSSDAARAQTPQHQWLARFPAGRRFAFVTNELAAQHLACAAGAGVALLPRFLVDDPAAHAGAPLVELTAAPRCDIEREIWLVVHPDVRRSPRVQRVADAIAEAVHAADGRL